MTSSKIVIIPYVMFQAKLLLVKTHNIHTSWHVTNTTYNITLHEAYNTKHDNNIRIRPNRHTVA